MYLTFLTKAAPQQLTWDDILNDPYLTTDNLPARPKKKVTKIITDEYATLLYAKRNLLSDMYLNLPENLDNLVTEEHYRHFEIPKKSNPHKKRKIDAPDEYLSNLQNIYKNYLENTLRVIPHNAAHAYVTKRSTVTAMEKHQKNNSKWYLQIDLKDFFNSITGEWLKSMLLQVYPFPQIDERNLDNLIKASLLRGTLPQGSHLSPTLTNLAMVPIDYDITETLHNYKGHHYVYTRYADDITISCKEKFDPREIIGEIKKIFYKWSVPFRINGDKTRFGSTAGRNYHLGIIINKDNKLSIGHEKNQKFRAQVFNFCTVGHEWSVHDVQKFLGIISYYKSIEPDFVNKVLTKYGERFHMNIIEEAKSLIK